MRFAEIVVKNLLRRKARSLLTLAGVSIAVAATVVLLTVAWGYSDSAVSHYAASQVDVVVVRAGVAERITSSLSASLADRLRELPGVAKVDGSLTEMVSLGDGSLLGVPLHGLDPSGFAMAHYVVARGRALGLGDRHAIILGAGLATALGKSPGDDVDLEGIKFSIAGVFQTGDALESNTAVATLTDLQELMDRPGQVSEFQIQVSSAAADPTAVRQLCGAMEDLVDATGNPLGFKAMPMRDFVAADTETGLLLGMARGTSAIAILLSSLGLLNTMLMSVVERTRELGILRAVGWSRALIVRLILGESILLSLSGVVLGTTLAWGILFILSRYSFTQTLVPSGLTPAAAAVGATVGLLAGIAGAAYPAYRATGVDPTEALRYE
ncbi:MAG: ABC transporter permease [Thermoguttaceae bacterium]|jgi:putative ABC transport system permease protein